MSDETDPRLENASHDLNALAQKLAEDLHAEDDRALFKVKLLEILWRYGPAVLEAALRIALKLAGGPIPPMIGGPTT